MGDGKYDSSGGGDDEGGVREEWGLGEEGGRGNNDIGICGLDGGGEGEGGAVAIGGGGGRGLKGNVTRKALLAQVVFLKSLLAVQYVV